MKTRLRNVPGGHSAYRHTQWGVPEYVVQRTNSSAPFKIGYVSKRARRPVRWCYRLVGESIWVGAFRTAGAAVEALIAAHEAR